MRSRIVVVIVILMIVAVGGYYVATQNVNAPTAVSESTVSESPISESPVTEPVAGGIPSGATEATVEYVHDGDTLFLMDGRKVRMLGINTPEIGKNLQCYGDEATSLLRLLLPQGTHVWVLPDIEPLDQYGRSLLFIYRDDATNINLEMLRQGAAEVEMYRPNLMFQAEIEATERAAMSAGVGMWGAC